MSEFSEETRYVIDYSIVEDMTDAMDNLLKMEPYSIDYRKLKDNTILLTKLSLIYDFLQEYVEGNEQISYQDLWDVVRLSGVMKVPQIPQDFQPSLKQSTTEVYVDGYQYLYNGSIPYGIHDMKFRYTGRCSYIEVVYKQKVVGAEGNIVELQNAFIDVPGEFEIRIYNEDRILIHTALVKFGVTEIPELCLNKLDTCGLRVTLILP